MGEVYRAFDTRLEREVAVKVLHPRFADDEAARLRFEREAKAIAALSHPNILAIFDFGVDRGVPYSVTELLAGETLRARLDRGTIEWEAALELGASMADGLAAAHARGIVHRDVKPENVFLTNDDRVKILDFGLARSAEPPPVTTDTPTVIETSAGMVVGTIGYMAPEQVRGQVVTPSVDLFALGCVLFEMVTGRRAFERATPADTMAAILQEPAPRPSGSGIHLPPAFDRLIGLCLEKSVERRIRSARDLAAALRAVGISCGCAEAPSAPELRGIPRARLGIGVQHSVAVLPFVASGDAGELEFLGEGIAEAIINAVAGVKSVRVVPRTLSFRHAGREAEPRALGVELNADVLLSGRIAVRGDQLHVQADLVDTSDESQLWGSRFIRPARDLETLGPVIADDIIEAVRARFDLDLAPVRAPRTPRPAHATAFQEFLRGRHHWNKWTQEGLLAAVEAYRRAIDLDPSYAAAHAALADAYGGAAFYGYLPAADVLPLARHEAQLALQIDPLLAEAHASLGISAMFFEWDWAEAERRITKALALDDRSLTAHVYHALWLSCRGRALEALEAARRAELLDPMSLLAMSSVTWSLLYTGDIEGAEGHLHRMLAIQPEFPDALAMLAHIAEGRRDIEHAVGYTRRWFPFVGLPAEAADRLREAYEEGGWTGVLAALSRGPARPAWPGVHGLHGVRGHGARPARRFRGGARPTRACPGCARAHAGVCRCGSAVLDLARPPPIRAVAGRHRRRLTALADRRSESSSPGFRRRSRRSVIRAPQRRDDRPILDPSLARTVQPDARSGGLRDGHCCTCDWFGHCEPAIRRGHPCPAAAEGK